MDWYMTRFGKAKLGAEEAATRYAEAQLITDAEVRQVLDHLADLIVGLGKVFPVGGETVEMEIGGKLRCVATHYCSHCREVHDGEGPCDHKELAAALAL